MIVPICEMRCHSTSQHLQQLYTGFFMLHSQRRIKLKQTILHSANVGYRGGAQHLAGAAHAHLDVVVNGSKRIHFDTHDAGELAESALSDCDCYFKRSYSTAIVQRLAPELARKVLPLGLNYNVYPNERDCFGAARGIRLGAGVARSLRRAFDTGNRLAYSPRLREIEAPPSPGSSPRLLFLAATHEPDDKPGRSQEKAEERRDINETRAQYIRLLRKRFGDKFTGGFSRSALAKQLYPDLVVPDRTITSKRNYLSLMKRHAVCIATTGLHGSNGWKLAEYVACSRAILTEPLRYEVPGRFLRDENFLEFTTPQECVEAAEQAMFDDSLRARLMQNNADYYRESLRPDELVFNALSAALG